MFPSAWIYISSCTVEQRTFMHCLGIEYIRFNDWKDEPEARFGGSQLFENCTQNANVSFDNGDKSSWYFSWITTQLRFAGTLTYVPWQVP
jgi:hypothetical protein